MTSLRLAIPASPRPVPFDFVLAGWAIFWVAVAIAVAVNTRDIAGLGATVSQTGSAVNQIGSTLGSIPIPGVSDAASSVQSAGASAAQEGQSSGDAVRRLSILLALAIAVIPSTPVLGLYLPIRLFKARDSKRALAALRDRGDDPEFREFLAWRAAQNLSFQELREISKQPWKDLAEGRFKDLADAELSRLGLREDQRSRWLPRRAQSRSAD
jgi:hypothetical protein